MPTQARTQTAQVTFVDKPHHDSTHEAITYVGGDTWKWTVATAIDAIENEEWAFYTLVNGRKAIIGVNKTAQGKKFLQTYSDGYWNNNLLALPECR